MLELSDAHPCGERSLQLFQDSQKSIQKSLSYLFSVAREPLASIFPDIQIKLKEIKKKTAISGFYHLINSALLDAIEAEDLKQIRKLARLFINLDPATEDLSFVSYRSKKIPTGVWELFDQVSLFHLPDGSANFKPSKHDYTYTKDTIQEGITILKRKVSDLWEEVSTFVKEIVILDSNRVIAGSSFKTLGLIYIKATTNLTTMDLLDYIVHEAAHQYIFRLSAVDPLCLNPPSELYASPLRKDPRPMLGIYHATFVTARLIYLFKALESQNNEVEFSGEIKQKIAYYIERYQAGLQTTMQHGNLTELGKKLILSTQTIIK